MLPASIGIILNAAQNKVLLVKRKDTPIWVLPGGGIEKGESPEAALIREIQEETALQIEILRKCAEYTPINRLARSTHVFICKIVSGEMALSSETNGIGFYPVINLPKTFFFPHALWLKEALSQKFIQRPLTEISYGALIKYFIKHPWQVLRFAWTRFTK